MGAFEQVYKQQQDKIEAERIRLEEEAKREAAEREMLKGKYHDACVMIKGVFEQAVQEAAAVQCWGKVGAQIFDTHAAVSLDVGIPTSPKRTVKVTCRVDRNLKFQLTGSFAATSREYGDQHFHNGEAGDISADGAEQMVDAALGVCLQDAYEKATQ